MPFDREEQPHGAFTVTLTLNQAAHQKGLVDVLSRASILWGVVLISPDLAIFEANGAGDLRLAHRVSGYRVANRLLWAIWRRLPLVKRRAPLPVVALSWVADRLSSKWLPASDIFQGLMGACFAGLRQARNLGAITVIDNPTLHPVAWQREVLADCDAVGLRPQCCERVMPRMQIRRHEREYELCDKIIVYSSAAKRSFQPFPYADKVVVINPGVDHQFFAPSLTSRGEHAFRVCYLGRIEAAKGLHYLIEAWKRLALPNAELVLAGRVLPEMAGPLTERLPTGIKLAGTLTPEKIAELYRESDLFVFPSMNEGLSLALLEAMSAGLPVIACADTGAEDCVSNDKEGLLVPGRNVDALASAILWCHDHPDQLREMGARARTKIEENFTLSHYQRRLVEFYKSLVKQRIASDISDSRSSQ